MNTARTAKRTARPITIAFIAALSLIEPGSVYGQVKTFYVATDGNDTWSGALTQPNAEASDGPFATLNRGRDALREARRNASADDQDLRVVVRGGRYYLDAPLALTSEDSGATAHPTVFEAEPGELVYLIGGVAVDTFKAVTDPERLKHLDASARDHVQMADLAALGLKDFGSPEGGGLELFFKDQAMALARWPNEGFVHIVEEAGGEKFDVRGQKGDRIGKWVYDGDRPSSWTAEKDPWVHGYWFWDWSDQRHKVSLIDTESRTIEVAPPLPRLRLSERPMVLRIQSIERN